MTATVIPLPRNFGSGGLQEGTANRQTDKEWQHYVLPENIMKGAVSYTLPFIYRATTMANGDDLTDAKIARANAETETKIARLEGTINTALATIVGKLDSLSGQVTDQRRDRNLIIGTIVLAALALAGMFWGAVTYGDAIFSRGMNVRDVVQSVIKEQQAPPPQIQQHH
jgi:hypothetical protein